MAQALSTPEKKVSVAQKATAIPMKAPPFVIESTHERKRYLKALFYGPFGVGKTFLCGTAAEIPTMNDVIIISAESGDFTLAACEDITRKKYNFDAIDTVPLNSFRQVGAIFNFLKLHCSLRDENNVERMAQIESRLKGREITAENIKRYRTVILDSTSEIDQYSLNQLLGITDTTPLDEETQTAQFGEYKRNSDTMRRLIRSFRDLPMNVLMVCGRTHEQDEQKRFHYTPAMTGKLSGHIQGFMDVVGMLQIGSPDDSGAIPRRLYVQPVGKFDAKCRFSSFKDTHFDNPTMKTILQGFGLLNRV